MYLPLNVELNIMIKVYILYRIIVFYIHSIYLFNIVQSYGRYCFLTFHFISVI